MRKLIQGIVAFRQRVRPGYRETFARLAQGQQPDCLFIACSDSRVVPNLFASTEPGDLFVTRNIGNLVPPSIGGSPGAADESAAAAIEYAVGALHVQDIVVCGHSNCGAMRALLDAPVSAPDGGVGPGSPAGGGGAAAGMPHLNRWLRHARPALEQLQAGRALDASLPPVDVLSQLNVLQQVAHVAGYPAAAARIEAGSLGVHAWWFDIGRADVYAYEPEPDRFVLIDEAGAARLLARLDGQHASPAAGGTR